MKPTPFTKVVLTGKYNGLTSETIKKNGINDPDRRPKSYFYAQNGFLYIDDVMENRASLTDGVSKTTFIWPLYQLEELPTLQEKLE